jgi:hypothetical protein
VRHKHGIWERGGYTEVARELRRIEEDRGGSRIRLRFLHDCDDSEALEEFELSMMKAMSVLLDLGPRDIGIMFESRRFHRAIFLTSPPSRSILLRSFMSRY